MLKSLNQLKRLRRAVFHIRRNWMWLVQGIDIDPSASLSLSSCLKSSRRGYIKIGPESLVAFKTLLYTYDPFIHEHRPIKIGYRCFIGGGSMILPGVTIGDGSIVGAGAIVTVDVPPKSIVAGCPAQIIQSDIEVGSYGRLMIANENTRKLYRL